MKTKKGKPVFRWIKNSEGKPDAMLTFAVLGFLVVLVKVLFAGVSITLMNSSYSVGEIDAATIGAILTPTLGAYVFRRHTDSKYLMQEITEEEPLVEGQKEGE